MPRPSRKSGRRIYGDEALQRLILIAVAQSAGFTLKEIGAMVQAGEREGLREFAQRAERKIAEIDAKLEQLGAIRDLLDKSRSCGCSGLMDCSLYAEALSRL